MANKYFQMYVDTRRDKGLKTPYADLIDTRRKYGIKTPFADWLGYEGGSSSGISEKELCEKKPGYQWVIDKLTGTGKCMPIGNEKEHELPEIRDLENKYNLQPLDIREIKDWIPKDKSELPYMKLGPYAGIFKELVNTPAYGGQTLEQLENARIAALQQDLQNQFGVTADELQRRLAAQAEAAGMYGSSNLTGAIGQGLSELGRQYSTEFAKGAAEIRGQRPELLLKERQQRAQIAQMWGNMDLTAQEANLDAALEGRLLEYQRLFNNGQLTLDAFNKNVNLMTLFFDYMVSRAKTDAERDLIAARIEEIYHNMDAESQANFREWLKFWTSGVGSRIGGA